MYLEIEIEKDRGREKKYVTLKLEEDTHKIKMKFDRKPDFEVPDFIMLGKRRSRAKRKVSSQGKEEPGDGIFSLKRRHVNTM